MADEILGPVPQTDHDYLVACYHLLSTLSNRVGIVEKDFTEQTTEYEKWIQEHEELHKGLERAVSIHTWIVGLVATTAMPLIYILISYIISHLH